MTFIWPIMLGGLLVIPLLVAGYVSLQRRRRLMVSAYGDPALLQAGAGRSAASTGPALRSHVPAAIFLVALTVLIVAMARPQAEVTLPRMQGTVMLVIDISGSMAADDVKPTRLDAAKAAATDFVQRQPPGVDVGVVTFSGAGFAAQAPTSDQGKVLSAIERLKVQTGTSIGQGIEAALKAIAVSNGRKGDQTGDEPPSLMTTPVAAPSPTPVPKGTYINASIVLLTDGENNEAPDPLKAAQDAANQGVRVYAVGVGTPEGAVLHLNGFTVRSRLDESTLQQIAETTGGTYYKAQTAEDLKAVYDKLSPQLVMKPQNMEVTALFAGAGIFILLVGGALSLLWLGRAP